MLFYANFLPFQKWYIFNFETSIALSISRGKLNVIYQKSKLILCEYTAFYFSEIAFTGLRYMKSNGIVFWGTAGIYLKGL
jgi:hypothetical protein